MRRAILIPLVVLGVALAATTGVAVVSAVSPPATTGRVVEVEPLQVTPGPADGTPAPAPTPTSTAPVSVTPHGSEDVGDDHGGRGRGGDDDDDSGSGGNSGKGGGSDD
jgi:hypothetical protein